MTVIAPSVSYQRAPRIGPIWEILKQFEPEATHVLMSFSYMNLMNECGHHVNDPNKGFSAIAIGSIAELEAYARKEWNGEIEHVDENGNRVS